MDTVEAYGIELIGDGGTDRGVSYSVCFSCCRKGPVCIHCKLVL